MILIDHSIVKLLQHPTHTDSNMATPLAPMFPLGVTPRPPINPAHRSLKDKSKAGESCSLKIIISHLILLYDALYRLTSRCRHID